MIDPMQDPLRPTSYVGDAGKEHPAEQVLRKLACWLGVGGYNADAVDAKVFHEKIVWGIRDLMQDKHAGLTQCGWADEFGNVFPMGAWKPSAKTWHDAHKVEWVPIYKASAEPERALFTFNEIAEAAARAALSAQPEQTAAARDELRRYLHDTTREGTPNEQAVARTALHLLAYFDQP